ncbi:MAG: phasin family protein [Gammaproteobacteria bacterium]
MKAADTSAPTGLDRLNGLLAWWGVPNAFDGSEIQAQTMRFQVLVLDLNKLFNEASSSQAQALSAANEQFTRALQELLSARQPPELMAAQSSLVTGLIESLAAQTGAWAELTQKLHGCFSAMVRGSAAEAGEHAGRPVPIKSQSDGERPASKASTKRTAQG